MILRYPTAVSLQHEPHRRVLWGRLAERPPAVRGVAVEQRDQESCAWEGQALADRTPLPAEIA